MLGVFNFPERRETMKYSFTCPPDGKVLVAVAKNDAEAIKKLTALGKEHVKEAHPPAAPMTDEEWEKFLRAGWKKQ